MKVKNALLKSLKGLIVGSSMLVPGVSGGTMALILGIYKDLIHAINNFFKDFKKSAILLAEFCFGALVGFGLFSRVLDFSLSHFKLPTTYFFIGTILGGVPILFKQAKFKKNDKKATAFAVLAFVLGLALVLSLRFIPESSASFGIKLSFSAIALQLVTGIIIAIALILPGISTTHMLLILGMYYTTIHAAEKPLDNLAFLGSMALFVVIGVFLTTNLLEKAMNNAPQLTYAAIIGFVLGSILEVFPGFPHGIQIVICVLTTTAGFVAINYISKFIEEKEKIEAEENSSDSNAEEALVETIDEESVPAETASDEGNE